MKFTYEAYSDMLAKLSEKGYQFANYKNWKNSEKTVILRHDVDNSLKKAVQLSEIEKDICCDATYFILLSTNFYNVHSKESRKCIEAIIENGGQSDCTLMKHSIAFKQRKIQKDVYLWRRICCQELLA